MSRAKPIHIDTALWVRALSHECRHYLALVDLLIEKQKRLGHHAALDEQHTELMQEHLRHASLLMQEVVTLSQSHYQIDFTSERFLLTPWLRDFTQRWQGVFNHHNTSVTIECDDILSITANPILLRSAFTNLISNSLRHHPRESGCHIDITAYQDQQCTMVELNDNGQGFSEQQLQDWRSKSSTFTGTMPHGLGLPLTASILNAMNIHMDIRNAQEGGAQVQLIFTQEAA